MLASLLGGNTILNVHRHDSIPVAYLKGVALEPLLALNCTAVFDL